MKDTIIIREATKVDAELLFHICRLSYSENFASHWEEGGLQRYLDTVYSLEKISLELQQSHIIYFIVFEEKEPIGFMKLNLDSPLSGYSANKGTEIEKIYFRPQHQGKGIGKQLMATAIDHAIRAGRAFIWLGVIDTNHNAIAFYKKSGFSLFDKIQLEIPLFKKELKGMWRMVSDLTRKE